MMKKLFLLVLGLAPCWWTLPLSAGQKPHSLRAVIRDAANGALLPAEVFLQRGDSSRRIEIPSGRIEIPINDRQGYRIRVSSEGYRDLETSFSPDPAQPLPMTFWLDRLLTVSTEKRKQNLLRGFVYDLDHGTPVSGALVSLETRGLGTVTDGKGYFEIPCDLPVLSSELLPPRDVLRVSAAGHATLRREDFLTPGTNSLIIDLSPGRGVEELSIAHKFLQPESIPPESPETDDERSLSRIVPPATIRVGTSCSCTSCSGVSVMSFETYVRRGLNDEWIASWADDSLRAGAVAYRSYGAWYVEHPISGSYDICSTTCCQVNDTDTSSATDLAGAYTAGFMLEKGGVVFRAEYSAENNAWDDPGDGLSCSNTDLDCGDGYAGSPDAGWSCITDSLCGGHGCFGHGRGMCQWGTQRLASTAAQPWTLIIDHYYNDEGAGTGQRTAFMTTPLYIDSVAAISPVFTFFQINLEVLSTTESDHEHILIGASLHSPSTGYISDPDNDRLVTVSPGNNSLFRHFDIPEATPEGLYDLYVSLYFDVDSDTNITTADKALDLVFLADAVNIIKGIFSDGFETGDCSRWSEQH